MCDIKKYENIYRDILRLTPNDTLELILAAKSTEERIFFKMVGDYLLQQGQEKAIQEQKC